MIVAYALGMDPMTLLQNDKFPILGKII